MTERGLINSPLSPRDPDAQVWDDWAERVSVVPWEQFPSPGYKKKGPGFYRKK